MRYPRTNHVTVPAEDARSPGAKGAMSGGLPSRTVPAWRTIGVFAIAWGALLLGARGSLFRDPGTFWHVLTGDRILDVGFPHTDWLTFSFEGKPWIAHQWLGEVAMAALHRLGGLDALLVATSAVLAGLLAWVYHRLSAAGVRTPWALLLAVTTFLASSHHFHVRPHVLSLLFFALLFERLGEFDAGRISIPALLPIWLVFLAWVNIHGAAAGGLATLALVVAGWIAIWAVRRTGPVKNAWQAIALVLLAGACGATAALTPYGLGTPRAWMAILDSPYIQQNIVEHASMARTGTWQVLPLVGIYLAALAGTFPRWRITELLPLVWLALAVDRIRNAPIFALAAVVALATLLPRTRWVPWLANRGLRVLDDGGATKIERFPCVPLLVSAVLVMLALKLAMGAGGSPRLARLDRAHWPVGLVDDLRAAARDLPPGSPILTTGCSEGSLRTTSRSLRIFVDDCLELFGDEFLSANERADSEWLEGWASGRGVSTGLATPGSRLDSYRKLRHAGDARRRSHQEVSTGESQKPSRPGARFRGCAMRKGRADRGLVSARWSLVSLRWAAGPETRRRTVLRVLD